MHRAAPPRRLRAVGLADYGKPGNYFERQIGRWSQAVPRLGDRRTIEAMDGLIAWLPAHIPPGDETCIVHGDFRLDNLDLPSDRAAHARDARLGALDARPPARRFCLRLHELSHPARRSSAASPGSTSRRSGIPTESDYVAAYCRRTGRERIEHWDFYLAFNLFRLAAILQGIMKRALDGTAASPQALDAGRRARPMAELGWKYAQRAAARV